MQVTLQFHAVYGELTRELLPAWGLGQGYEVAVAGIDGLAADEILFGGVEVIPDGFASQILFRRKRFQQVDGGWVPFLRANPGFLSVAPGHLSASGLREAMLGAVGANAAELAPWRRVVAKARKSLLKGAVLVGPSGVRRSDPCHRYSVGALELARSGVPMLAGAGEVRFELEPQQ